MSSIVKNVRQKMKRTVSHKDPEVNFDDPDASADEETVQYVNKEVEDHEKEGDKYPEGRPNSFLNRMISHGNKKTEDEVKRDYEAAQARQNVKPAAVSAGQTTGAAQSSVANH